MSAFSHELEHEVAHLSRLPVFRGIVIENGDVFCPLNQAIKVISVYADFMVGGRQAVCLSERMWYERRVFESFWHIPFVA